MERTQFGASLEDDKVMQSSDKLMRFSGSPANSLARNKVLRKLIGQSGPPILIGVAGEDRKGVV